jgi:hypothetical protein
MLDEVTDEQLIRLVAVICRGKIELRAASYVEDSWSALVDAGLLRKTFISWGRPQYTLMANDSAGKVMMDNLSRAASIAVDYELFDIVESLLEFMSPGHLPELLSHENEELRNLASNRLDVLANSISEEI